MKKQFEKNTYVRYASNGICLIEDIIEKDFFGKHEPKEYFVLRPLADNGSTVYVPADNELLTEKMERVLGKSEIDALIRESAQNGIEWSEDRKERREYFDSIISRCGQTEYLKLISCLYIKKRELAAEGKKLASSDEAVLRQAEKSIENEFSFILGIPSSQVDAYIQKMLE